MDNRDKELSKDIRKISEELETVLEQERSVNEQLQNFSNIIRKKDTLFFELAGVWETGDMCRMLCDIDADIQECQNRFLNELENENEEIKNTKRNLQNQYDDLMWEKEKNEY